MQRLSSIDFGFASPSRAAVIGVPFVFCGELDEPHTEGQLRVRALDPELVWRAHAHEPWRPRTV